MTATRAWRPAKESVVMASEREIVLLVSRGCVFVRHLLARIEGIIPLGRAGPLFNFPLFNDALLHNSLPELGVISTDLLVASAPPRMGFADRMDDGGHFPHFRVGRFGKQRQATDVFLRNDGLIEKSPNLIERLAAESDFPGEPAAFFADMYPMPAAGEALVRPVARADPAIMSHGSTYYPARARE